MHPFSIFVVAGGLLGAAGVALLAASAHLGGAYTGTAANFMLLHAPVLVAVGLCGGSRAALVAAWGLVLGVALFAGDLLLRDAMGQRLFAYAAPMGGTVTILSWLALAASPFFARRAGSAS